MKEILQSKSTGMVYPATILETRPKRQYGALELKDDNERNILHRCFTEMLNISCIRDGGIIFDNSSKEIIKTRRNLLLYVAKELLGEDFSYEELC